jgi:hypothetical protein
MPRIRSIPSSLTPASRRPSTPTGVATAYVEHTQAWRATSGPRGAVENTVGVTVAVAAVGFDSDAEPDGAEYCSFTKARSVPRSCIAVPEKNDWSARHHAAVNEAIVSGLAKPPLDGAICLSPSIQASRPQLVTKMQRAETNARSPRPLRFAVRRSTAATCQRELLSKLTMGRSVPDP